MWGMMRGVGGVRKSIHYSWLAKRLGLGLGILCWGFNGVQEETPSEKASNLQIGSVVFPPGQYTSPQLHPCHRQYDQDGHQDSSLAFLKSRPCSLWLLLLPKAQRLPLWDNWGDKRGCDEGDWHAHTRGLPWGLPEVLVTVQQVHCSRRLLERELEFHVWTINKSAHTKKSANLFNDPPIIGQSVSTYEPTFYATHWDRGSNNTHWDRASNSKWVTSSISMSIPTSFAKIYQIILEVVAKDSLKQIPIWIAYSWFFDKDFFNSLGIGNNPNEDIRQ